MKALVVDKDYGAVTPEEIDIVEASYNKAGITIERGHFADEAALIEGCLKAEADIALCTGNPPFTRKVLEQLPQLKVIHRFGAGVNSIDLEAAAELGKIVINLPGFCAKEIADLATGMIMGLIRNTAYYDREIRKGNWPKCKYFMPGDVREMTLGLYGFGVAARYLQDIFHNGFGTKIISCDPYVSETVKQQYPHVEFVSFDELLAQSDIISIHVILTPETTHVFNKEAFKKMKNTSMIINTSRGPVIDQKDLAWALENEEIRYAGLDTVEVEPMDPNDPLLHMDNVILSPHSGSYGVGAKKTQLEMVSSLIPNALESGELPARNVANKGILGKESIFRFV